MAFAISWRICVLQSYGVNGFRHLLADPCTTISRISCLGHLSTDLGIFQQEIHAELVFFIVIKLNTKKGLGNAQSGPL
jgi:hypothetical protein